MTSPNMLEEVLETWGWVRAALIDEAENIPSDRFDFRPTPAVRTVADVVRHLLSFGEMMVGELTRDDGDFARQGFDAHMSEYAAGLSDIADKRELIDALREQHERGERRFRERGEAFMMRPIRRFDGEHGTRIAWLVHGVEHESYHTGQLTVYTRMMGLVPALTQKIQAASG